ncbi:RluA family pseudouridine synthase [Candidatus Fokinia crypta]|uniref:Pseudouridine synthase n=1 Tax=Candidatus Fokinia crypta TaxID=1920990 RepID=A0ABZ0UR97_9RICK|nr:RluA family pseudouridine synthase [Candidatus Fokinia cryptica]WPX97529.1 Ribosomal large subunit pseudouridine synthase D [Candidatus Fokinia cryptica]
MNESAVCKLCVDNDSAGLRIDSFILCNLKTISAYDGTIYSRNSVQNLIVGGFVSCNENVIVKSSHKVKRDDIIQILFVAKNHISDAITLKKSMNDIFAEYDIRLLYEDEHFLAIDKPPNLIVHHGAGTSGIITLTDVLSRVVGLQLSFSDSFRAGIVHRLDKDTSGVMLIAKTEIFHNKISEKIRNKEMRRRYICFVYGVPIPPVMRIASYIVKDRNSNNVKMKNAENENGKYAVTNYRVLGNISNIFSAVECELETGRTHQIRVHMSEHGHPVIGDLVYSKEKCVKHLIARLQKLATESDTNEVQIIEQISNDLSKVKRQLLHSKVVSFTHPITEQYFTIEAQLRQDMEVLATYTISPLRK